MTSVINPTRSAKLDVIRGVAILAVVAVHSFQASVELFPVSLISEASKTFVAFSYLRFGVELFFLLSGWLIFSIHRGNRRESGKQYLAKRASRIWPLWIAFSILSFISLIANWQLSPVASRFSADSWWGWVIGFALVFLFLGWFDEGLWNVPAGGWSIQAEIGHYSLFWVLRKVSDLVLLSSILVGYASFYLAKEIEASTSTQWVNGFSQSWLRLGLFGTWPFFVAGGLAFIWFGRDRNGERTPIAMGRFGLFVRAVLISVILVCAWWIPIPFGMTYEAVFVCLLLIGVSWILVRGARTLALGVVLGKYSYFIYFAHFWVLQVLVFATAKALESGQSESMVLFWIIFSALYVCALIISALIAIPSWKYFESKWIKRTHQTRT